MNMIATTSARACRILNQVCSRIDISNIALDQTIHYKSEKVREFVKLVIAEYGTVHCNELNTVTRIKSGKFMLAASFVEACWDRVYSGFTREQLDIMGIA